VGGALDGHGTGTTDGGVPRVEENAAGKSCGVLVQSGDARMVVTS
jgi:hypothetical protein